MIANRSINDSRIKRDISWCALSGARNATDKSIHRIPGDRAALHMHRIPDLLRGPRNRLPQIRLLWSRGLGDIIRKYKSELEFGVPAEGSTRARHGPTIRHASTPLHHSRFGSMVSMERRSLIIFHDWTGEDNWESGVERWTLSIIGFSGESCDL